MLNLIPEHTRDFDYLFRLVTDRNKWFIKLRFGAVFMLLVFFVYLQYFSDKSNAIQNVAILVISTLILIYNFALDKFIKLHEKGSSELFSTPMHIAFVQTICDLMMLLALVYVTGLLSSPFGIFFVFHAIIGSMILPGRIVSMIFFVLLIVYSFMVVLVEMNILPHFDLLGIDMSEKMNVEKSIVFLSAYWIMLMMSVKFANSLAASHFRREQELNEALRMIEDAEQDKQKYVMAVVHEIKSPIAAISSYLNILLGGIAGRLDEKVIDILRKSKLRADDAISLTNDILDVSRVKLIERIKKETVIVEEVVSDAVETMRSKIEDKKLDFDYDETPGKTSLVSADRKLMQLIVSNILSNAVKYTPEGGKIRLCVGGTDGNTEIEISDSGIGIPGDEQDELFTEFFRASNARKSRVEGTGLGLAAVKKAVEKNGGEIIVKSPGSLNTVNAPGTTVILRFPVTA